MKYTKLAFHGHTKKTKSIKQKKIHTEIANFLFWSFPTPQVIIGSDPWWKHKGESKLVYYPVLSNNDVTVILTRVLEHITQAALGSLLSLWDVLLTLYRCWPL